MNLSLPTSIWEGKIHSVNYRNCQNYKTYLDEVIDTIYKLGLIGDRLVHLTETCAQFSLKRRANLEINILLDYSIYMYFHIN